MQFDDMNETGRWILCMILGQVVTDHVMDSGPNPPVITVNGHKVLDIFGFFNDVGTIIDEEIKTRVAKENLESPLFEMRHTFDRLMEDFEYGLREKLEEVVGQKINWEDQW